MWSRVEEMGDVYIYRAQSVRLEMLLNMLRKLKAM